MANDPQRALSIKNLENLKLRQRIQELENDATQNKTKHSDENESFQRQHDFEIKSKIKQLNENNKHLMAELVDAKRNQRKAEEEIVAVSENMLHLKIDLKTVQQEYETCRSKIEEMSMETIRKNHELQKPLEDLNKCKQQNAKLQEEIVKLFNDCNNAKAEIRKKDSQILQLTNCMEESSKHSLEQEILEKTIQKLKADNSALQSEIQETDSNRNNMAEIMLKNKQLLKETKSLKSENEKLLIEKSTLENQLIQNEEHTKKIEQALKAAEFEISEINEKTIRLDTELQDASMALIDRTELVNKKIELEKMHLVLKNQNKKQEAELENRNQEIISFGNEITELKQRIHGLEAGNVKKLQIIAKLKAGNDFSMCNT